MTGPLKDLRLPADAEAAGAEAAGAASAGDETTRPVDFIVDGEDCSAYPGDTIAVALYAAGVRAWRQSRSGEARGLLCGMGVCLECLVSVDGMPNQRACQVEVQPGMVVRTTRSVQAAKIINKEDRV